ncbi:hypothetical protein EG856_00920 [Mycoplasmopsis phocirhinis]|uniref:Uncharacterized protein n=1 Tax=Mycoplasmopsis phocirhinis TaxID=142650 RepID=A0A4V0ZAF2_9BACT|nr:hypothetical protein [Mycoplasmopsis phocirhinis]QBF34492.1 hypothetical protein EG856_00920 [Mycoplasmopsis phocirhinis]
MEKLIEIKTENRSLPVLKPIAFLPDFIEKLKGESLKSNVIMLVAEDEDDMFFVACEKEWKPDFDNNDDYIKIKTSDGVCEDGKIKEITLAKGININTIYKMNYYELMKNLVTEPDFDLEPYLGINNQLEIVDRISKKLNEVSSLPKLVVIRKTKKTTQNSKNSNKIQHLE